jgi:hypothetical protein
MKSLVTLGIAQAGARVPHRLCALEGLDRERKASVQCDIRERLCPVGVNSLHYRAAALLSALPQLAESIRAAKRFRVVP